MEAHGSHGTYSYTQWPWAPPVTSPSLCHCCPSLRASKQLGAGMDTSVLHLSPTASEIEEPVTSWPGFRFQVPASASSCFLKEASRRVVALDLCPQQDLAINLWGEAVGCTLTPHMDFPPAWPAAVALARNWHFVCSLRSCWHHLPEPCTHSLSWQRARAASPLAAPSWAEPSLSLLSAWPWLGGNGNPPGHTLSQLPCVLGSLHHFFGGGFQTLPQQAGKWPTPCLHRVCQLAGHLKDSRAGGAGVSMCLGGGTVSTLSGWSVSVAHPRKSPAPWLQP